MIVFAKSGSFVPSALHDQLVAAGVDCSGVTATQDATGTVTEVQIICADGTTQNAVDAVCGKYTAPPSPAAVAAAATAAAWVELRMIRDRILAQTDYIEVYLASPASFTPLPQAIQDAITANKAAWVAWRQALRDMPAQAGLNPIAAVKGQPHVSTQSPWPAAWPQPPAAPVIHFT